VERGVFVSYRRADTGWAANVLTAALRRRTAQVFQDNSSIALGTAFADVIEDAVRSSAVLVALIGQQWDTARLHDPQDWVRREIQLAHACGTRVVPVLVDRAARPDRTALPPELRFLADLQNDVVRQSQPDDVDLLAGRIAALLPDTTSAAAAGDGVAATRADLDSFLRAHLPAAQQWSGNRERLVNLALAVLDRTDRLTFAALARMRDGPPGSATVFVTATDIVAVEVGEDFRITGEIRFPRSLVRRVEVVPTLPLFADAIVHTGPGGEVRLQGLFRGQAGRFADHLRS
jgi:hypothetical protein